MPTLLHWLSAWSRRFGNRAAIGMMLACLSAPGLVQSQDLQTLRQALRAEGVATTYPTDVAERLVDLPDEWQRTRPGRSGPVWYRVLIPAAPPIDPGDLPALYIEHVCADFAVLLNGRLVHSDSRSEDRPRHLCNHPQLVPLPGFIFGGPGSVIDLRVKGPPLDRAGSRQRAGALSTLEFGPLSQLRARHAWQTALRVTLPQVVSATLLLMGCFMFVLGFLNRRESHLAYFGALCFGLALAGARLWLSALPVSLTTAEFLLAALLPFITLAAVQFLLRYARARSRWIDRALLLQCGLMPATLFVLGAERMFVLLLTWYGVFAVEVLAAAALALHRMWRQKASALWWMGCTLGAIALAGVVEAAAQLSGSTSAWTHAGQLLLAAMLVLMGLRLLEQHGRALQQAESGRARLEQRIREATAEIERNFAQTAELKVEQVTERERKRIAADLHDDLGAKLLTIVHTSDNDRISSLAREALEEMRLSVRGLTGKPVRLADALGDWRAEVVSRLSQAGIEAEWTAPEDLPQTLSARAYVQTTRILREATSNIIKHSGASRCTVQARIAEGDFQLEVRDNGDGIRPDAGDGRADRGHGLATMKQRAKQLQGQCLVESGPGHGTVMRLTLPLDRATEGG